MAQGSKKAGPGKPFGKGQSGNPGGMPAWVKEMRELAGSHSREALERLVSLMRQKKNPRIAKEAADSILDRAGLRAFAHEPDKHEVVNHDATDAIGRLATLVARRLAPGGTNGGGSGVASEPSR